MSPGPFPSRILNVGSLKPLPASCVFLMLIRSARPFCLFPSSEIEVFFSSDEMCPVIFCCWGATRSMFEMVSAHPANQRRARVVGFQPKAHTIFRPRRGLSPPRSTAGLGAGIPMKSVLQSVKKVRPPRPPPFSLPPIRPGDAPAGSPCSTEVIMFGSFWLFLSIRHKSKFAKIRS